MNSVSLNYLDEYNITKIEKAISQAIVDLNIEIKPKSRIMIKVCLPTSTSPDLAKTTNPAVVVGLVKVLNSYGAKCVIVDSPYKKYNNQILSQVYLNTGMLEVENLTTCELNYNLKTYTEQAPAGVRTKSFTLLEVVKNVDYIINLSKVKMDEELGFLCCLSNLIGLIPGELKTQVINSQNTIDNLNNYLIDLYSTLKDKLLLNIADGIVALEAGETQRLLSCLAIGKDIFSVDACLIDILGLDINNSCVASAAKRGLIDLENPYKAINENIKKFKMSDFNNYDYELNKPINSIKKQKSYYRKYQKRVEINSKQCKGCEICSKICPTGAITMKYDKNNELYAEIDYKKCIFCYKCHTACPYKVVKQVEPFGYKKLVAEIEKENK